jgi:cell division protein FtsI/penicillin-binding protein 2
LDSLTKAKTKTAALTVILFCLGQTAPSCLPQRDLHSQATVALLEAKFPNPDISFLALDGSGKVVAERWPDLERPVPIGSLIKPFLALAYGRTHQAFPEYVCVGKKTCWLNRGHGKVDIRKAIEFSCNSYFHQLVAGTRPGFAQDTLAAFGLDDISQNDMSISESRAAPLTLARAYLELAQDRQEPAAQEVLQGMSLSARQGTAKAAGAELGWLSPLAKTGTARCTHPKKAPGDGFAVVIAPSGHPHIVLLVRLHGRPGSMAAAVAGQMVAAIENQKAER